MLEPPAAVTQAGIPPAEVDIDEHLIRELLRTQHPDLAGLALTHAATGWDNVTYRLGERFAVRLPRIAAAVELLRHEQEWLSRLAPGLPVPVPAPLRLGEPGAGYPWPWSLVPWVAGRSADLEPLAPEEAAGFGRFLAAVHQPAPEGFPRNDYRGVPLESVAERFEGLLSRVSTSDIASTLPLAAVRDLWCRAIAAPIDVPETCVHGDLHPRNLVVDGGRLAAVLDWGDMTTGDRAVDLGAAWMLFPPRAHEAAWAGYGPISRQTLDRAAGWALLFGLSLLDAGLAGDRVFAEIGRTTLERVCQG